jgi:hypothetical protein
MRLETDLKGWNMEYIYNLSDFDKVTTIIVLCCLSAALLFLFLRITIGKYELPSDSYFGVNIIGTMTSLCSVLFVFVLIQAISTNAKINTIVTDQLSEMYKFEKHLSIMPKNYVNEIKPHFEDYINSIITDQWKIMGTKLKDNKTEEKFNEFLLSVAKVQDMDVDAKLIKEDFSTLTDGLIKIRYTKLRAKGSSLPAELYFGMMFLISLNVFQFFLLTKRTNYSLLILLLHVAAQGLIFGLIFVYDHPFYGDRGVKAEVYQDVLGRLQEIKGR